MAFQLYRASVTPTTPVATTAKGAPLTNLEIDGNFKALNDDVILKANLTANTFTGTQSLLGVAQNEAVTVIVASAISTAIGAAASNNVDISGVTTITSFDTVAEGINRKGRFTGVLTLTHNATSLILPGVVNITTAVNDRYEARSLGAGNWIVTKYEKADGTALVTATLTDDTTTNTNAQYLGMARATSGVWTAAYVASTKLYFNPSTGTLNSTAFNSLSDASKKTNVQPIVGAVATVDRLRGVEFNWVENGYKSSGVIAQQIEAVLPHLVSTNMDDGVKSVNYSGIIGYLIEANKELAARIVALENR